MFNPKYQNKFGEYLTLNRGVVRAVECISTVSITQCEFGAADKHSVQKAAFDIFYINYNPISNTNSTLKQQGL